MSEKTDRETRRRRAECGVPGSIRSRSDWREGHKAVAASTESMLWQHRRLPAEDVARDFSVTAQTFADTFVQYVAVSHGGESVEVLETRRRETCALIWAMVEATFAASA